MPPTTLRPSTYALGVPGLADMRSHAGEPASHKQAHHKPPMLDAQVAERSLLTPRPGLRDSVQALAAGPAGSLSTAAAAPRKSLSKLARAMRQTLGQCIGLGHGEARTHADLLRYAGTRAGTDGATSNVARRLLPALDRTLHDEGARDQAQNDLHQAEGLQATLEARVQQASEDLARSTRRAAHFADRAHGIAERMQHNGGELDGIRTVLAEAEAALAATRLEQEATRLALENRRPLLEGAVAGGRRLGDVIDSDHGPERDTLAQRLARLAQAEAQLQHDAVALHTELEQLEQQSAALERKQAEVQRYARINAQELFDHAAALEHLESLQPPLAAVRAARADTLKIAEAQVQSSRTDKRERYGEDLTLLVQELPGFERAAEPEALREALRNWTAGLAGSLDRTFAAAALPVGAAASIGLRALGIASAGNAQQAEQAMRELRGHTLATLLPPPQTPSVPLSEVAHRTAGLLARVPRGIQVLVGLLTATDTPLAKERVEVARLQLRIQEAMRRTPEADTTVRQWLEGAQRAAQRALHATDPAEGLEASPPAERAAYLAVRNGYETNAPGSPYARANGHLQKIADWLHDVATGRPESSPLAFGKTNPLRSLPEALTVGSATALPTPARRAGEKLAEAADHLVAYLMARRALLPPGQLPPPAELALQALAEQAQDVESPQMLASMTIDAQMLKRIGQRQRGLAQHFGGPAARTGASENTPPAAHAALNEAWQTLQRRPHSLPEAMALFAGKLAETPPIAPHRGMTPDATEHWTAQEATQRANLATAANEAVRLLRDGDPQRVQSGAALFDLCRDMIEMLEWRDRLRVVGQKVSGLNAAPLSAAAAVNEMATGIGVKLIGSVQHNEDRTMEFYMGRTGMYVQFAEQSTHQFQAGAGVNFGYSVEAGSQEASVGAAIGADWRGRYERGTEQGIQLRIPRLGKGEELALRAQFLDMFEHLLHMASPEADGRRAKHDWIAELLAHHPSLNIGLIDGAPRRSAGTETNVSASAGARFGEVAEQGRRAGLGMSAGVKTRQDSSRTQTQVAGYMSTLYRDSTVQTRAEASLKATAGVQLWERTHHDPATGKTVQDAALSASVFDLGRTIELRSAGATHFCTLFTFGGEIDSTRSDRASDFLDAAAFEREVRRDWNEWVHYGTAKLPQDMDPGLRHAVAERQLEDLLAQAHTLAGGNSFMTMFVDRAMKAEAAPLLDALRAQADLWREAGRDDLAQREERAFDDLLGNPALWEPTLLLVREKTKLQAERGIDFGVKRQTNRAGEAMRTVAQWPPYEPVPQPEPAARIEPARRWAEPSSAAPATPITPARAE